MNLLAFLQAVYSDWISLMSGVVSVILTIVGFRPGSALTLTNRARKLFGHSGIAESKLDSQLFWIAGLLCFCISSARVWTIEHGKVLSQTAALDCTKALVAFGGDPFPVGQQIQLLMAWHNYGPSRAVDGRHLARVYLRPSGSAEEVKKMIGEWETLVKASVNRERKDPIFYENSDRNMPAVSEEILTESIHQEIYHRTKHLFVVGAVRFRDGAGEHEAHACLRLMAINAQGLNWATCEEYVTPIEIAQSVSH